MKGGSPEALRSVETPRARASRTPRAQPWSRFMRSFGIHMNSCAVSWFPVGSPLRRKQLSPASLLLRYRGKVMAVAVGFEPTVAVTPHSISSAAPSAARTRYLGVQHYSRGPRLRQSCELSQSHVTRPRFVSGRGLVLMSRFILFDDDEPAIQYVTGRRAVVVDLVTIQLAVSFPTRVSRPR